MASLQPTSLYVSLLKVKATIICALIYKGGGGGGCCMWYVRSGGGGEFMRGKHVHTTIPDGAQTTLPDGAQTTLPDSAQTTLPDGAQTTLPDGVFIPGTPEGRMVLLSSEVVVVRLSWENARSCRPPRMCLLNLQK